MQWVESDDQEADTVADRAVESVADSDREEETDRGAAAVTQTVLDCDIDNVGAWSDSRTWTHQR